MPRWSLDAIGGAFDSWRWYPPSSVHVSTPEFDAGVTPGSYAMTYVYNFRVPDAARTEAVLDALHERIRSLGGTGARFRLTSRSLPADLEARLVRRGYRRFEDVEVLAWELLDDRGGVRLPEFPPSPGVVVREVDTEDEYVAFSELASPIFGDPMPPAATQAAFRDEFRQGRKDGRSSGRFVAWEGPRAVARGGMDIVDGVARLWGSGVLEDRRRRGIYGAVVRARCEAAAGRGATLALVAARVGTSGPILKRRGFVSAGTFRVLEVRW